MKAKDILDRLVHKHYIIVQSTGADKSNATCYIGWGGKRYMPRHTPHLFAFERMMLELEKELDDILDCNVFLRDSDQQACEPWVHNLT